MENILIRSQYGEDWDGEPVRGTTVSTVKATVYPVGGNDHNDIDDIGQTDRLEVLTEPHVQVEAGDQVKIREHWYEVVYKPWDWSTGRQPWHPQHRMRTQFIARRSNG